MLLLFFCLIWRLYCVESFGISRIWLQISFAVTGCVTLGMSHNFSKRSFPYLQGIRPDRNRWCFHGKISKGLGKCPPLGKWKVLLHPHYNYERLKSFARIRVGNMASFPKDDDDYDSKLNNNRWNCMFPRWPFQNLIFGRHEKQ